MASQAYVLGAYSTAFGKKIDQSYKRLTREVYTGLLDDIGAVDGSDVESGWFSNTTLYTQGQTTAGAQVLFTPLVREGLFPERVPMINVHNACASGSSAVRGAYLEILSGAADVVLVVGVEKMLDPQRPPEVMAEMFKGGIDRFDEHEWRSYYAAAGDKVGKPFDVPDDRSMFMDTYAMQAAWHMQAFGTTQRQIAAAAAKSHNFGALNNRAQYRYRITPEEVMNEREISFPLTKPMCAPMGDGAAALLVVSENYLNSCSAVVRSRAVKILACESSGGKYRELDEPGLSQVAAQKAYKRAGVKPADISLVEVHDATSFSEIYQLEMLGFCKPGEGGPFIEDGGAGLDGDTPLNTSGGLVAKGHPIGATGVSMIVELVEQLRGEAGERQVHNPQLALAENGGGVVGFDESVAFVTILER